MKHGKKPLESQNATDTFNARIHIERCQAYAVATNQKSFGLCPCKRYVAQSLLSSLFLKKINFIVCMLMHVLTFR